MEREGESRPASTTAVPRVLEYLWGIIATGLSLLYTAIVIWPAAFASLFADGHFCSPIFRMWAWLIFRTFGMSAELVGMENLQGVSSFVLVSNHQSLFDIIAVFLLIPREMRFLAKREIKKIPLIGFTVERSENIVIDRASGGKAIRRALTVLGTWRATCGRPLWTARLRDLGADNPAILAAAADSGAVARFEPGAGWLALCSVCSLPLSEIKPAAATDQPAREARAVLTEDALGGMRDPHWCVAECGAESS